jgi:hypothetical protein
MAARDGLPKWPMFEVVYLGSMPCIAVAGSIDRNASMTTLPFTDYTGSSTTPTALGLSISYDF